MVMAGPLRQLGNLRTRCDDRPWLCGLIGFALLVGGGWLFLAATSERALGFSILLAVAGAAVGAFGLLLLNEPIRRYVGEPGRTNLARLLAVVCLVIGAGLIWLAVDRSLPLVAIVGSVVLILGLLVSFAGLVVTGRSNPVAFVAVGLALLVLAVVLLWMVEGADLVAAFAAAVGLVGLVVFKIGLEPFIDGAEDPAGQRNDVLLASVVAIAVGAVLLYLTPRTFDEPLLLWGVALAVTGLSAAGIALVRFKVNRILSVVAVVAGLVAIWFGAVRVDSLLGPFDLVLLAVAVLVAVGAWFIFRGEALVAVLLLGFVLGWVLVDRTADEAVSPAPDAEQVVVAFGDSYISGEGAPRFFAGTNVVGPDGNQCRRAPTAYPYLVAERLQTDLIFLACSGATSEAIDGIDLTDEPLPNIAGNRDQLVRFNTLYGDRLDDVAAVLVGVGGNDVGFSAIIQACLLPQNCASTENGRTERWFENVRQVGPRLTETYRGLLDAVGEDVPIVVVTYPTIVRPDPGCSLAIDDDEIQFVAEFTAALNNEIRQAAVAAGVNLFDAWDRFDGRLLCDDDPATNFFQLSPTDGPIGLRLVPTNWTHGSMHPRIDGHQLLADGLVSEGGEGGFLVDLIDSVGDGEPANPEPALTESGLTDDPVFQELPDREWIQQRLFETVRDLMVPVSLLLLGGLAMAFGVVGLRIPILRFLSPDIKSEQEEPAPLQP